MDFNLRRAVFVGRLMSISHGKPIRTRALLNCCLLYLDNSRIFYSHTSSTWSIGFSPLLQFLSYKKRNCDDWIFFEFNCFLIRLTWKVERKIIPWSFDARQNSTFFRWLIARCMDSDNSLSAINFIYIWKKCARQCKVLCPPSTPAPLSSEW